MSENGGTPADGSGRPSDLLDAKFAETIGISVEPESSGTESTGHRLESVDPRIGEDSLDWRDLSLAAGWLLIGFACAYRAGRIISQYIAQRNASD